MAEGDDIQALTDPKDQEPIRLEPQRPPRNFWKQALSFPLRSRQSREGGLWEDLDPLPGASTDLKPANQAEIENSRSPVTIRGLITELEDRQKEMTENSLSTSQKLKGSFLRIIKSINENLSTLVLNPIRNVIDKLDEKSLPEKPLLPRMQEAIKARFSKKPSVEDTIAETPDAGSKITKALAAIIVFHIAAIAVIFTKHKMSDSGKETPPPEPIPLVESAAPTTSAPATIAPAPVVVAKLDVTKKLASIKSIQSDKPEMARDELLKIAKSYKDGTLSKGDKETFEAWLEANRTEKQTGTER